MVSAIAIWVSVMIISELGTQIPERDMVQQCTSVTNSSSGLIFVKIRALSGRLFSKNPGEIRAEIRAKI